MSLPSKVLVGSTGSPLSVVRYFPIASKLSRGRPSGSIRAWQTAHPAAARCNSSRCRFVIGVSVG